MRREPDARAGHRLLAGTAGTMATCEVLDASRADPPTIPHFAPRFVQSSLSLLMSGSINGTSGATAPAVEHAMALEVPQGALAPGTREARSLRLVRSPDAAGRGQFAHAHLDEDGFWTPTCVCGWVGR